jgi:hypothetical protein
MERGIDGKLMADPKKFPSGIKALADRLTGMGEATSVWEEQAVLKDTWLHKDL